MPGGFGEKNPKACQKLAKCRSGLSMALETLVMGIFKGLSAQNQTIAKRTFRASSATESPTIDRSAGNCMHL